MPKLQQLLSVVAIFPLSLHHPSPLFSAVCCFFPIISYIFVPLHIRSLFSVQVCGVYPALVTSRDLATIFAEGVGGKVRLDTDCLSFVDFVEVLWQIAERALIIIPERQDTTAHNNMRLAMVTLS